MNRYDCPGCATGMPRVAIRDIIEANPGELPVGWRPCLDQTGVWHAPNRDEAIRIQGGNPSAGKMEMQDQVVVRRGKAGNGPLESSIRMEVRKALESRGFIPWDFEQGYRRDRCPSCEGKIPGGTRVPKGIADIYVTGRDVSFWVECKRPGASRTQDQVDFAQAIKDGGVACYLVTSAEDIDRLDTLLRELGRLPTDRELNGVLTGV